MYSERRGLFLTYRHLRILLSVLCWTLILFLLYLIYGMSGQAGEESSQLSLKVTRYLASAVNSGFSDFSRSEQNAVIEYLHPIVRKLAHFSEYAVLGALLMCAALCHIWSLWARVTVAGLCSGLAGLMDEFHQLFVSGRAGSLRDAAIDFCGAVLGICVICALRSLILSVYRAQKNLTSTMNN